MDFLPKEKDAIRAILLKHSEDVSLRAVDSSDDMERKATAQEEILARLRNLEQSSNIKNFFQLGTVSLEGEVFAKIEAVLEDVLWAASFSIFATFGRAAFEGYSKIGLVLAELFWWAWQNEASYIEQSIDLKPRAASINRSFERLCDFVDVSIGAGIVFRQGGNIGLFSIREMSQIPTVSVIGEMKLNGIQWIDADFWNPKTQTESDRQTIWWFVTYLRSLIRANFPQRNPSPPSPITNLEANIEAFIARRFVLQTPQGMGLHRNQVLAQCLLSAALKHLDKKPIPFLSATLTIPSGGAMRWTHEGKVVQVALDGDTGLMVVLYQEGNTQEFRTIQAPIEPLWRACQSDYPLPHDQRVWNDVTANVAKYLAECISEVQRALPKITSGARITGVTVELDGESFDWALKNLNIHVDGKPLNMHRLRKDI